MSSSVIWGAWQEAVNHWLSIILWHFHLLWIFCSLSKHWFINQVMMMFTTLDALDKNDPKRKTTIVLFISKTSHRSEHSRSQEWFQITVRIKILWPLCCFWLEIIVQPWMCNLFCADTLSMCLGTPYETMWWRQCTVKKQQHCKTCFSPTSQTTKGLRTVHTKNRTEICCKWFSVCNPPPCLHGLCLCDLMSEADVFFSWLFIVA